MESSAAAVAKMKEEKFAYMEVSQPSSGNSDHSEHNDHGAMVQATQAIYGVLAASGDQCSIVQVGPNLFNGNLIIAWTKDFPYAPLFNY